MAFRRRNYLSKKKRKNGETVMIWNRRVDYIRIVAKEVLGGYYNKET